MCPDCLNLLSAEDMECASRGMAELEGNFLSLRQEQAESARMTQQLARRLEEECRHIKETERVATSEQLPAIKAQHDLAAKAAEGAHTRLDSLAAQVGHQAQEGPMPAIASNRCANVLCEGFGNTQG